MKLHLALSRHTQTVWNAQRRYTGQRDIPLNEIGRQQARDLSRKLAHLPLSHVYCSDLIRTHETTRLAVESFGITPVTDPRLREVDVGQMTGLTKAASAEQFSGPLLKTKNPNFDFRSIGGESAQQVLDRHISLLKEIAKRHNSIVASGPFILLVGHGTSMRLLIQHFGHEYQMPQGECQIVTFEI